GRLPRRAGSVDASSPTSSPTSRSTPLHTGAERPRDESRLGTTGALPPAPPAGKRRRVSLPSTHPAPRRNEQQGGNDLQRILELLAIATVAMAAGVSAAQAKVIVNDTASVGFAGFVPCANGGACEILSGAIDVHNLVTSTVNGNSVSSRFQFQPQGG